MMALTAPDQSSEPHNWDIAGIQHEIFLRIFPGLRHNLVSPVSVSRMTLSILRRNLEKGDVDKNLILQQISKIDRQLEEAVLNVRALQLWENNASVVATPVEIITQGIKLMSTQLSMRNITIDYVPTENQDFDEVAKQPFLYSWLGLLCYLEDHIDQPVTLKLEQKEPKSICIELTHPLYDVNALHPLTDRGPSLIDKGCLLALCKKTGIQIRFDQQQLSFSWE